MDKYYVYALLIGSSSESMTPFYIGKGCGKRLEHHFKSWSLKHKSYKNNKIKAAISQGVSLKAVKLYDNLPEQKALELEQQEILWFNTTTIKLCNIYDGGLAKNYNKNLRPVSKEELKNLIESFLLKPGVKLLSDWIKHTKDIYTVGTAKNIWRGETYKAVRAPFKNFGGTMNEEQIKEYRLRLSARVSGCNNPTYLPKLNNCQILLAKVLSPDLSLNGIKNYISTLGFAKPNREQSKLLPPKEKVIKPPKEKVIKPPKGKVIKPPKEKVIKPPKEKVIKPPKERVIKPPKERVIKPPKERVIKLDYNALERGQIMQMYLEDIKKEPLKMSPENFVKKYKLIVKARTIYAWFERSKTHCPKAIGNKSNGGKATALKTQRPIQQFKDGFLLEEYLSCTQAANKLNYSQGNIRNACEGVLKTAYGFQWRYKSSM
jgi:hypothetical protein